MSAIPTTMTEAKDPDTINTTIEEAHKKALSLISSAKKWDSKDKTLTNATAKRKEAPNQASFAETGAEGERSKSCDPKNVYTKY